MSRTRTYGQSVAIQTGGPDAVDPAELEAVMDTASDRLSRVFSEFMKRIGAIGVELDADSYDTFERQEGDRYVMGYTINGRQKRNVLQRIVWAIRL